MYKGKREDVLQPDDKTTEDTLQDEGDESQVEGQMSDVTKWVRGAVRIEKPRRSQAGGANQSQRSQSGR